MAYKRYKPKGGPWMTSEDERTEREKNGCLQREGDIDNMTMSICSVANKICLDYQHGDWC